jgi:hypothetical protein
MNELRVFSTSIMNDGPSTGLLSVVIHLRNPEGMS